MVHSCTLHENRSSKGYNTDVHNLIIGTMKEENQVRLKLNGSHQPLFYVDVNLLGDNINTVKNTETLIHIIMEVSLEVNA
jgi:hypothetical protein